MLSGRRAFKGAALQVWFMLSVRGYKSPCLCFHRLLLLLLLLLPRQDITIPASSTAAHTYPNTRTQRTAVKTWLDGVWRDKWWSVGVYDENCCFTHTQNQWVQDREGLLWFLRKKNPCFSSFVTQCLWMHPSVLKFDPWKKRNQYVKQKMSKSNFWFWSVGLCNITLSTLTQINLFF